VDNQFSFSPTTLTASRLIREEREQQMLDDIQQTASQHEGLGQLLQLDSPDRTIEHIKSSLGMKRDIGKDIEDEVEAYNIAVCQTLGRAMQDMLPRELRDMVYEHLTGSEVKLFLKESASSSGTSVHDVQPPHKTGKYFITNPRTRHDPLCPEHFWRDAALGPDLARELMESWYRTTTFKIEPSWYRTTTFKIEPHHPKGKSSPTIMDCLLSTDRFQDGLQLQLLISRVKEDVTIVPKRYLDDKEWQARVLAELDEFSKLRKGAHVQLLIYVSTAYEELEGARATLELCLAFIRPVVLRLRELDHRVRINVKTWWRSRVFEETMEQYVQATDVEVKESRKE
jgi:hypothetical protein